MSKLIWTKEKCEKEALKYKNRKDFSIESSYPYYKCWKMGWLNEMCSHMEIIGNRTKRSIYCFEFKDNSVYIGLTYNINKRKNEHLSSNKSAVFLHITKTKLVPVFKQLTDYMTIDDAIKMEGSKIEIY